MPGLSATVGEMIASLEKVAGIECVKLIQREPDPNIQRIVDGWPQRLDASRAQALGFRAETSFEEIIKTHVEDECGGDLRCGDSAPRNPESPFQSCNETDSVWDVPSRSMGTLSIVALLHGPDRPGLVARVAGWIFEQGGNILHADQHRDAEENVFFQRVEWSQPGRAPHVPRDRGILQSDGPSRSSV